MAPSSPTSETMGVPVVRPVGRVAGSPAGGDNRSRAASRALAHTLKRTVPVTAVRLSESSGARAAVEQVRVASALSWRGVQGQTEAAVLSVSRSSSPKKTLFL